MHISILTIFPRMFDSFKTTSIIKHAIQKKLVQIDVINFREYATDKHKSVDDVAFGGGAGMVLKLEPIVRCLNAIKKKDSQVYLLSPEGKVINQSLIKNLVTNVKHLILIAGHYEGFDYRIYNYIDGSISVGDFILTGGEIPAMLISDAITRLIPGVINKNSLASESFNEYLLDHPSYTKPAQYENLKVPDILLSGNHAEIAKFNQSERIRVTKKYRLDLYKKYLKFNKGNKNVNSKNK